MWFTAIVVALFSARYFLVPPPLLTFPAAMSYLKLQGPVVESLQNVAPYLYNHHRLLLLVHIACGITALVLGLFQFVPSLRSSRPALHRTMGLFYISGTVIGGITGFPLSFMMLASHSPAIRPLFYPMFTGLVTLSIVWPVSTLMALTRARQRRFAEHRAWMIRSYALTFAAPTVRLIAGPLLLLTGDLVISLNIAFVSWPFNLMVAELLIRRAVRRFASTAVSQVVSATTS